MNRALLPPQTRQNSTPSRARSYGLAAMGSIASAGAQFLLSLQLLHAVELAQFGGFAFLLVCSQLSLGIAVALLCAPYPVVLLRQGGATTAVVASMFAVNLVLAIATGLALGVIAVSLALGTFEAALFAAFGAINVLRWFGRAHAYEQQQSRVVLSDISYGLTLGGGIVLIQLLDAASLLAAGWALVGSATIGLLALAPDFLRSQFAQLSLRAMPAYRQIWQAHSRWSLLGVVTTEGTANAHAYIVTLVAGSSGFAPLAASALLIRPMALAMNALSDLERPQLARILAQGGKPWAVRGALGFFRRALLLIWVVCLCAGLSILLWQPRLLFPPEYGLPVIWAGALQWLAIALLRSLRMPDSVLLQAAGQFRPLALASLVSCAISIAVVAVVVAQGQLVFSLVGIALGEAVFAAGIWMRAQRLLRQVLS